MWHICKNKRSKVYVFRSSKHFLSFPRVKTLMKTTCLQSVINGPLSGAAGVGPGYRTSTLCFGSTERARFPRTASPWEPPPAVRVFWRTSVSRRFLLCTAKAVQEAVIGVSVQRTLTALTAFSQILPQCQTALLSRCLTYPKNFLTMAPYLISM